MLLPNLTGSTFKLYFFLNNVLLGIEPTTLVVLTKEEHLTIMIRVKESAPAL